MVLHVRLFKHTEIPFDFVSVPATTALQQSKLPILFLRFLDITLENDLFVCILVYTCMHTYIHITHTPQGAYAPNPCSITPFQNFEDIVPNSPGPYIEAEILTHPRCGLVFGKSPACLERAGGARVRGTKCWAQACGLNST